MVKYIITPCIPKLFNKLYYFFSLQYIRISGKNINFDGKKSIFHKNKRIYSTDDIYFNNILVSKKEQYGTKNSLKYFMGYKDNDIIRPLCMRLPQMTGYAIKVNKNAKMSFKKKLLKKYSKIWETIEVLMKITFESKPIYGEDVKYMKTKIKTYADNIITNFQRKSTMQMFIDNNDRFSY